MLKYKKLTTVLNNEKSLEQFERGVTWARVGWAKMRYSYKMDCSGTQAKVEQSERMTFILIK